MGADWLVLGCIVLVALGVRLFMMSDVLSYDEAQHYLIAKSPLLDDFVREFRLRSHPPIAYLLMKPFLAFGHSVYWVRMASLLCGLASIVVAYRVFGRILGTHWPALTGTLLIALAPIFVKQSIEARHYSLSLFLVWASLWLWQHMRSCDFERGSHHLCLAVLQLLAVLADYSAVFSVTALSLVIYPPLVLREARRAGWGRIARCALPQLGVALVAGWFFFWHFDRGVPDHTYTEAAVYPASGAPSSALSSPLDVGASAAFIWRRLGFFQNAILPAPFGLAVLFALALAYSPWLRDDPRARACRSIVLYALLSLGLTIVASLLGIFPFGGLPRHNAVLVPGIVLGSYLALALSVRASSAWFADAAGRAVPRVAAVTLIAIALFGIAQGLRPGVPGREAFERRNQGLGTARYRAAPASIVANWRGRTYASWWFLPGASPHQTRAEAKEQLFDYSGVRVAESESPELLVARALTEVRRSGEVWVLLSHFRRQSTEHLLRVVASVQREGARSEEVDLIFAGEAGFFPPLAVLQLRRSASASRP